MQGLKLVVAGTLIVGSLVCFGVSLVPTPQEQLRMADTWNVSPKVWECDTDSECTEECLKKCETEDECRKCWDVFLGAGLYEMYETRVDYLND